MKPLFKIFIPTALCALLVFPALTSVVMVNECRVKAKVLTSKESGGSEFLTIKVVSGSKLGSAGENCDFYQEGGVYTAFIRRVYKGKFLRIPPLKPGQLKVNDTFVADVLFNGGKLMNWVIVKTQKDNIPEGTSFTSTHGKSLK